MDRGGLRRALLNLQRRYADLNFLVEVASADGGRIAVILAGDMGMMTTLDTDPEMHTLRLRANPAWNTAHASSGSNRCERIVDRAPSRRTTTTAVTRRTASAAHGQGLVDIPERALSRSTVHSPRLPGTSQGRW